MDPFGPSDLFGGATPSPTESLEIIIIVALFVLAVRIITGLMR